MQLLRSVEMGVEGRRDAAHQKARIFRHHDRGIAVDGRDAKVRGQFTIAGGGAPTGIEGLVDANYDRIAGTLELGSSWVATAASRLDVSGTLGKALGGASGG